jgi:multicomponent Na+:H+ antiporter subunit F
MRTLCVAVAVALLAISLVHVYRLGWGPTVFDRLLGLSAFGTTSNLVLLLAGAAYGRLDFFVDISLAYAILSFVGSLAAARYFERTPERR